MLANKEIELISKGYLKVVDTSNKEKIILGTGEDYHYTLHFGTQSKILDIHKTYHDNRSQETLFQIQHFTLARILCKLRKPLMWGYFKYWFSNEINIGKLKKFNCFLTSVTTDELLAQEFINITKSGKRFRFKKEINYEKLSDNYILPDQLIDAKPGAFLVYRFRKEGIILQGILLKNEGQLSNRSFTFCTKKNYNALMRHCILWTFKLIRETQMPNKKNITDLMWNNVVKKYFMNKPRKGRRYT